MAFHRAATLGGIWDSRFLRPTGILFLIGILLHLQFIYLTGKGLQTDEIIEEHSVSPLSLENSTFPRKIWQTSKANAASLDKEDLNAIQSWLKLNQKHRFEILTRHSTETYVKDRFPHRQDVVETYIDLQEPVLKSDFARYLVLLGDGGVYADLDTVCHHPVDSWIPAEYEGLVNMVVGIEYDGRGEYRWGDWTRDLQFAGWAVLAKPGHLASQIAVDKVVKGLRKLASYQGTTISQLKVSFREILDFTGPAMFTDSIIESIAIQTNTNFTWQNISALERPTLAGDVLVLPINGFGAGQQHSNSGKIEDENVLVHHLFKGSWKDKHPLIDVADERDYEKEKMEKEKVSKERKEEPDVKEKKEERTKESA